MNPSLLRGIIIGMGVVLFCFGVFIAIPTKRTSKANLSFNERTLDEFIKRNGIGENQLKILSAIDESLVIATRINERMLAHITSATPESERKARRERIAAAMIPALPHIGCCADLEPHEFAGAALQFADHLIAELDKPEP